MVCQLSFTFPAFPAVEICHYTTRLIALSAGIAATAGVMNTVVVI